MKKLLLTVAAMLLPVLFGAYAVSAQTFVSEEYTEVTNRVDGTLYAAGNDVLINADVDGDVFCAGQNVEVHGDVKGDVICAGQNVKVDGTVTGDVRLAGQTVELNSSVTGSATIAAQTVTLSDGSNVAGDVTLNAGRVTMNGEVGRDAVVNTSRLTLNGSVGRNVAAQVQRLQVGNEAAVAGTLGYTSISRGNISDQAQVGRVDFKQIQDEQKDVNGAQVLQRLALFTIVSLLVTSLFLVLLFPRLFQDVTDGAIIRPWWTLLIGFISVIVIPALILLLFVTIIGIPLALIAGTIWMLLVLMSSPLSAYFLGRQILRQSHNPILMMLTGSAVLLVLYLIPILNVLAVFAAFVYGVGISMQWLITHFRKPAYEVAETEEVSKRVASSKDR